MNGACGGCKWHQSSNASDGFWRGQCEVRFVLSTAARVARIALKMVSVTFFRHLLKSLRLASQHHLLPSAAHCRIASPPLRTYHQLTYMLRWEKIDGILRRIIISADVGARFPCRICARISTTRALEAGSVALYIGQTHTHSSCQARNSRARSTCIACDM